MIRPHQDLLALLDVLGDARVMNLRAILPLLDAVEKILAPLPQLGAGDESAVLIALEDLYTLRAALAKVKGEPP